jgi:hypothetical protein
MLLVLLMKIDVTGARRGDWVQGSPVTIATAKPNHQVPNKAAGQNQKRRNKANF